MLSLGGPTVKKISFFCNCDRSYQFPCLNSCSFFSSAEKEVFSQFKQAISQINFTFQKLGVSKEDREQLLAKATTGGR